MAYYLPLELILKIFNMKRNMEIDNHWGWKFAIDASKNKSLDDCERWWVGENRWAEKFNWPDLDKATLIYYKMYIDNTEYVKNNKELYDLRFKLLDEIEPSRVPN